MTWTYYAKWRDQICACLIMWDYARSNGNWQPKYNAIADLLIPHEIESEPVSTGWADKMNFHWELNQNSVDERATPHPMSTVMASLVINNKWLKPNYLQSVYDNSSSELSQFNNALTLVISPWYDVCRVPLHFAFGVAGALRRAPV